MNRTANGTNGASAALQPSDGQRWLDELRAARARHPLWNNPLLRACREGSLTVDDFRLLFAQYYLYARDFTRYLAALMANCEDDLHRALLSANLWEEGGEREPGQRHTAMFRRFLTGALQIDLHDISYIDASRQFAREYLHFCMRSNPCATSAFLSLGTEGVVAQIYEILVDGMLQAGIDRSDLDFFYLHMACDDDHAETLEQITLDYASAPGWYETCLAAMNAALDLRNQFFTGVFREIERRKVATVVDRIQRPHRREAGEASRCGPFSLGETGSRLPALYSNTDKEQNIDFTVDRIPVPADVFDVRLLHIAAHSRNERHHHPHESLFYVRSGRGVVHVGGTGISVQSGDVAFVPRWVPHCTENLGDEELVILAITDFRLTSKLFVGDPLPATRAKGSETPLDS
jgi:mannose-6-phosphate isomerase-like protein (cupin superfamily)/pyrroloquinoline quinone (PQQ) biosynthesis protein C